jgi:glutathione S-transferase
LQLGDGVRKDLSRPCSPETLERVHPLGKAPAIEDGPLRLAESGAIIEYLISTYGRGKLAPAPGGSSWARYIELLHFADGSAMFPLLVHLLGMFTGGLSDGLKGFITPDIAKILKYLDARLPEMATSWQTASPARTSRCPMSSK